MDMERWWPLFVDLAAVVWIGLFVVDVAAGYGPLALSPPVEASVRDALQVLLVVFLLDLVLLYRWSEKRPWPFVRANWFWILTVIPWFRPLRLLRVGRSLRALKLLAGSRRAGSLLNKSRRMARRYWRKLRE